MSIQTHSVFNKCFGGGGKAKRNVEMVVVRSSKGEVSKTLSFVLKRASLPSSSLICTISSPTIIEVERGQRQRQKIERA